MLTVNQCLKKAMACLLAGDTKGRDEWCAKTTHILDQVERVRAGGPLMPGKPIRLVKVLDGILTPTKH